MAYISSTTLRRGGWEALCLLFAVLHFGAAQARVSDRASEGIATIRRGDTLQARKAAVGDLMKNALRAAVTDRVQANTFERYRGMLEDNLVGRYSAFVQDYQVLQETAEGSTYQVRARVSLYDDKLIEELVNHGFIRQYSEKPKLLLFIAPTGDAPAAVAQPWWSAQAAPAAGALQDRFTARLRGFPLQILARQGVKKALRGPVLRGAFDKADGNLLSETALIDIAQTLQSSYVIHGVMGQDFMSADLSVINVDTKTRVGRVYFNANSWEKMKLEEASRRRDAVVYDLVSRVVGDWLTKWHHDERIALHFTKVDDLSFYQKALTALKKIPHISAVYDGTFAHQTFSLFVRATVNARDLVKLLNRNSAFRKQVVFSSTGERSIEARRK